MTGTAIDTRLRRLREAAQRVSDNLLALEADPVRIALRDASLSGKTADRWRAAEGQLTTLWAWYGELERLLDRATAVRGSRARVSEAVRHEVAALLDGSTIEAETQAVPLEERALLDASLRAHRCTPAELLDRMSERFAAITEIVVAVRAAWDGDRARVAAAKVAVAALADDAERDRMRADLVELETRVAADPLGTDLRGLEAIEATLATRATEAERAATLRAGLPARLDEVRSLIDAAQQEEDAARQASVLLAAKIVTPEPRAPAVTAADEARALDEAVALAAHDEWAEAAAVLDACARRAQARLDEARRSITASRAPIEQRNRMRGLLDAYLGKAHSLGRIEDRGLTELYDAAHDALFVAPTDLDRAAALVRRYQEALR